jgi:predicted ATPase
MNFARVEGSQLSEIRRMRVFFFLRHEGEGHGFSRVPMTSILNWALAPEVAGSSFWEERDAPAIQFAEERKPMRRFIITGAPGAGKTAIIRQLELDGFSVVEEAATGVIAAAHAQGSVEPWRHPSFIDAIARLQRDRQIRASYEPDEVQFHDRCVVCTAALAIYLGHPFSLFLVSELERVKKDAIYQNRVFFIRNLGFVTPTEARRISFEDTVRFEKIHEETYRDFGFELVSVAPASVAERVSTIKAAIR